MYAVVPRPASSRMPSLKSTSRLLRTVRALSKFVQRPHSAASAGIIALASLLAASGLTRASDIQVTRAYREARAVTESVVPYRAHLPMLASIDDRAGASAAVVVIGDSAAGSVSRLCDLSREMVHDRRITWVALSPVDAGCRSRVHDLSHVAAGEEIYRELDGARVVVLSTEGRALYSRRTLPPLPRLQELAQHFSSAAFGAVAVEGAYVSAAVAPQPHREDR